MTALLVTISRQRIGFFINGYRKGRTLRVAIALLGAIEVIYLASLWLKYAQHIVWAPIAGGAILVPIILFAMQRWQDTYRSEFDSASAIKG